MSESPTAVSAAVEATLRAHDGRADALLEMLHDLQASFGHVPREAVPLLAQALNRSRAEVQGVIGFYHDFRETPSGQTTIHLCRAEACQAMGSAALEAHVMERLGIGFHETTGDGRYSLEPVYCLGNCACTPSVRIGDEVFARVTPERFDELLEERGEAP